MKDGRADNPVKVLIIEDNPGDVRMIREMLLGAAGLPFELECADNLSAGLEQLAEEDVDVVLLDLGLPDSLGIDTLTSLHDQVPEVPIVVLTGFDDISVAVKAMREGAENYLVKGQADGDSLSRSLYYAIEQKSAGKTLSESEKRLRTIFETAQDSIFIKDCALRYIQVNPAMEKLFGAPVSELIGRTDDEFFGEAAGAHVREVDSRVLGGEIIEDTETGPVDGVLRTFHTIKMPMRDSSGEVTGLCGITRDITRQKELEQKLRNAFDKLMKSYEALAIPVIQVHDGVLAIPLMGVLDDLRINQLTETMLHRIVDTRSLVVILDLTAVRSIDSAVANRLLDTVAAARLLGANCILTGIGPEVAAATVRLGLDGMNIVTRGSLQEGLAYAMQRVGGGSRRGG